MLLKCGLNIFSGVSTGVRTGLSRTTAYKAAVADTMRYHLSILFLCLLPCAILPSHVVASCDGICDTSGIKGDIDNDGDVDCDDAALFLHYVKTGTYNARADFDCSGCVDLNDSVIWRNQVAPVFNACGCFHLITISCPSGVLTATPANINAPPGDWIRIETADDCITLCQAQTVIDCSALGVNGLRVENGICAFKIPSNATLGSYKYDVSLKIGTFLCQDVSPNPLDPYITVASVSGVGGSEKPAPLSVRNIPNPFTPTTSIHYLLSEESTVTVVIYDLHGARVKTLITNTYQPAGEHLLPWDGKNELGQDLPSGVYIYNVTANQHSVSHRMVLTR